jgi:hypothetical protein
MDSSERLTWQQIRERYPDQWVVLVDHDWQEHDLTRYNTARPSRAVLPVPKQWHVRDPPWMPTTGTAAGIPARFAVRCFSSSSSCSSDEGLPIERSGDLMTVTARV